MDTTYYFPQTRSQPHYTLQVVILYYEMLEILNWYQILVLVLRVQTETDVHRLAGSRLSSAHNLVEFVTDDIVQHVLDHDEFS